MLFILEGAVPQGHIVLTCSVASHATKGPQDHQCESVHSTAKTYKAQEESEIGTVYVTLPFSESVICLHVFMIYNAQ